MMGGVCLQWAFVSMYIMLSAILVLRMHCGFCLCGEAVCVAGSGFDSGSAEVGGRGCFWFCFSGSGGGGCALCCLSVCGGLSNAVGCRGRDADEAERVGFAQQEGWGPIRSLGYGCTSEA
jgi:hypothetical protein